MRPRASMRRSAAISRAACAWRSCEPLGRIRGVHLRRRGREHWVDAARDGDRRLHHEMLGNGQGGRGNGLLMAKGSLVMAKEAW